MRARRRRARGIRWGNIFWRRNVWLGGVVGSWSLIGGRVGRRVVGVGVGVRVERMKGWSLIAAMRRSVRIYSQGFGRGGGRGGGGRGGGSGVGVGVEGWRAEGRGGGGGGEDGKYQGIWWS